MDIITSNTHIILALVFMLAGFFLGYDARANREHTQHGRLTAWEIERPDGSSEFIITCTDTLTGAEDIVGNMALALTDTNDDGHVIAATYHPYPGGVEAMIDEQYEGIAILNTDGGGF